MIVYYITFLDVLGACHWVLPYLTFFGGRGVWYSKQNVTKKKLELQLLTIQRVLFNNSMILKLQKKTSCRYTDFSLPITFHHLIKRNRTVVTRNGDQSSNLCKKKKWKPSYQDLNRHHWSVRCFCVFFFTFPLLTHPRKSMLNVL